MGMTTHSSRDFMRVKVTNALPLLSLGLVQK